MPPLGVLLVEEDDNPSPMAHLPAIDAAEAVGSPNINAFKAPYDQTKTGVHLSIPVAPTPMHHNELNLDCYNGADSEGELGPFYDAVMYECDVDSDDDVALNSSSDELEPEPVVQTVSMQERSMQMGGQQLYQLSNAQLKEMLRMQGLSGSGRNKKDFVDRLLTATPPEPNATATAAAPSPPLLEQSATAAAAESPVPPEQDGTTAASEMTEQQCRG
jgi:hypothetical protein